MCVFKAASYRLNLWRRLLLFFVNYSETQEILKLCRSRRNDAVFIASLIYPNNFLPRLIGRSPAHLCHIIFIRALLTKSNFLYSLAVFPVNASICSFMRLFCWNEKRQQQPNTRLSGFFIIFIPGNITTTALNHQKNWEKTRSLSTHLLFILFTTGSV